MSRPGYVFQWWMAWWRHRIGTFSALLALCVGNWPVTGEFPSQRPMTRSFDVIFDLSLNKRLSKQSRRWWFETPSRSLWRHCNGIAMGCWYSLYIAVKRFEKTHPIVSEIARMYSLCRVMVIDSLYRIRIKWCMYSRDEQFMHSIVKYFGVYLSRCSATLKINIKITLSCKYKQFANVIRTLLYTYPGK